MGCVNKNTPEFKKIASVYGDNLAEKLVRGYSKNVKGLTDDFYYPSIKEIKEWLTYDKSKIVRNVSLALENNPLLSKEGILNLLSGVVHEYKGLALLTTGPLYSAKFMRAEVMESMYTPNLNIVTQLTKMYPDIFRMYNTRTEYGKVIQITPRKEGYQGTLFAKPGQEIEASSEVMRVMNDFLKRIGVNVQVLKDIVVDGVKQDANGVALIMQKLVQVVEGKESSALPEEAMHFAVAIIKQTNPALYKKLLSEINDYKELDEVNNLYGNDPYYMKDGKPDVLKLKEEAIAKVLAAAVIGKIDGATDTVSNNERAQSWWKQIIEWLKSLFNKSGFDRAAMSIVSGKFEGTVEDAREDEGTVLFQKTKQQQVYDSLVEGSKQVRKVDDGYESISTGKKTRRVTDFTKDWYERRFQDNALTKTEYETAIDDIKKETGTLLHSVFEYIFDRYIDENGNIRQVKLDSDDFATLFPNVSKDVYDILEKNFEKRIAYFGPNSKFMKEVTIYDPKRNVAGTIDLLVIRDDGKVNILDWKFMDINTDRYDDIPWYKVSAWKIQMGQYKLIVKNNYGVKEEEFEQTRMIPIQAVYTKINYKNKELPKLQKVRIGAVDPKEINDDYLLPVGLEEERTGNQKIDAILERLNIEYKKLSERVVPEEEKPRKAEQLNALFKAIRRLQIKGDLKPLVYQASILNKEIENIIDLYNRKFKDQDPTLFSEDTRDNFIKDLSIYYESLDLYVNLYTSLKSMFTGTTTKADADLKEELRSVSETAREYVDDLQNIFNEFTAQHIAGSEKINDYLKPEKIIKGVTRLFSTTSTLQLRSLHVMFKKVDRASGFATMETSTELTILKTISDNYNELAKRKGLSKKDYYNIIKKKDKNELISEYDTEFYSTLKAKIAEKDFKWIIENVDVDKYKEFLKEQLEKELQRIEDKVRPIGAILTQEAATAEKNREIAKAKALYDVSNSDSPGWLMYDFVKKFPKERWQSKEWIELNKPENIAAKALYDYIQLKNKEFAEIGYINKSVTKSFLPFVPKGFAEALVSGGNLNFLKDFLRDISVDEGELSHIRKDPKTGKPINVLPKYFTHSIDGEVSIDLVKNMGMYIEAATRYKYMSKIENQIRALVEVERNKKAISTSMFSRTEYKNGELQYTKDNSENTKLVEAMMKAILYDQRYIQDESFDQLLGALGKWGKKLNEKLGIEVFPEELSDRQVSINRIVTQLNTTFQLSTLGLNLLSASSNYFGGNVNSLINAGKYFTKTDFVASEMSVIINKLSGEEGRKMIAAIEYFMPLTENYNRETIQKLSLVNVTGEKLQDGLMYFMRKSDWNVQTANFFAYLRNSAVIDGELVNVRTYLRKQSKYQDRYKGPAHERARLSEEFEKEVKQLIDEKGVLNISKVENGKLVIPGINRTSEGVIDLRRKVQSINKDALGNLTATDLRMINLNIYGKSFMVFKNWIPRLVDVRMGNIKYNVASDAYEWGRTRMVFRIFTDDLLKGIGRLKDSVLANDKGIEYMRELFEQKSRDYTNDTGKVLEMTEEEFMDLVRNNIKNQIVDVMFMVSMMLLVAAIKTLPDDEEDPAVKNQYRLFVRALDKFKDELSYFYDPTSIQGLISKGVFPSMTLLENFTKGLKNFMIENWAIAIGDEQLEKDTKVIKYWMKTFPFTNQMVGYLPMFYPELAKDLGVRIQSNYGIR